MGIAERKERERAERRLLILDKTRHLVLERGLTGFSMQDVADAAEVSKATLYLYYENKEAILTGILSDAFNEFIDYVQERIPEEVTGIEALRLLWAAYIDFFGESEDIFVLIGIKNFLDPHFPFSLNDPRSDPGDPAWKMVMLIAAVLERGVRDGTLEPSLIPQATARTVSLIASAIIEQGARLPRSLRDARQILREMRDIFGILIRGLAAPGTDPSLLVLS